MVENLPIIGSDHCLVVLTTLPVRVVNSRHFRIEAIWMSNPNFHKIVDECWNKNLEENAIKNFVALSFAFSHVVSMWGKRVWKFSSYWEKAPG